MTKYKIRLLGNIWLLDITEETKKYFDGFAEKVEMMIAVGVPRADAELEAQMTIDENMCYKNDDEFDFDSMNLYITLPNGKMINIHGESGGTIGLINLDDCFLGED